MWTETKYYKFASEEEFKKLTLDEGHAVDIIGTITGIDGWHVNVRWLSETPSSWIPFEITTPTNPKRVFF
jgi:hypothetical protein